MIDVNLIREQPEFAFETEDYLNFVTRLGLVDYQRGAKLSGHGFWIYIGDGVLLE